MGEPLKFIFGTSAKDQVATRLQAHIDAKFGGNSAKAAKNLGISRQRLFSYTSAKTLPRPRMFDLILQRWELNLLSKNLGRNDTVSNRTITQAPPLQALLFDKPITLKSDELKVVIRRKGPRLLASIEIYSDVEIA